MFITFVIRPFNRWGPRHYVFGLSVRMCVRACVRPGDRECLPGQWGISDLLAVGFCRFLFLKSIYNASSMRLQKQINGYCRPMDLYFESRIVLSDLQGYSSAIISYTSSRQFNWLRASRGPSAIAKLLFVSFLQLIESYMYIAAV